MVRVHTGQGDGRRPAPGGEGGGSDGRSWPSAPSGAKEEGSLIDPYAPGAGGGGGAPPILTGSITVFVPEIIE